VTNTSPAVQCSVGIDVAKDALDILIDSSAEEYRVANQASESYCKAHVTIGMVMIPYRKTLASAPEKLSNK